MNFSLPDTEGNLHSPGDAPATVVVFTANHCPYALAWHDRLVAVASDYEERDVRVLMISPNNVESHPADGPEAMADRVAKGELGDIPYLYDEDQSVARAYDARTTPHVFVLDSDLEVQYDGAPDADYQDESLEAGWVREALDAVLAGETPATDSTPPVGCAIKWKP